jgi:hypothetical protein
LIKWIGPELALQLRSRILSTDQVQSSGDMLSYAWPLADGLAEVLCLNFPDTVTYLRPEDVARRDPQRLLDAARRNTAAEPIDAVHTQRFNGGQYQLLAGESVFVGSKIRNPHDLALAYLTDPSPVLDFAAESLVRMAPGVYMWCQLTSFTIADESAEDPALLAAVLAHPRYRDHTVLVACQPFAGRTPDGSARRATRHRRWSTGRSRQSGLWPDRPVIIVMPDAAVRAAPITRPTIKGR